MGEEQPQQSQGVSCIVAEFNDPTFKLGLGMVGKCQIEFDHGWMKITGKRLKNHSTGCCIEGGVSVCCFAPAEICCCLFPIGMLIMYALGHACCINNLTLSIDLSRVKWADRYLRQFRMELPDPDKNVLCLTAFKVKSDEDAALIEQQFRQAGIKPK